jgi:hypothetical protein
VKQTNDHIELTKEDLNGKLVAQLGYGNEIQGDYLFQPGNLYYFEVDIKNGKDFDIGVQINNSEEFWVLKTLYGDLEHLNDYTAKYTTHSC